MNCFDISLCRVAISIVLTVISAADGAAHDLQREQGGVRLLHDPLQQPQDHRILHQASGGQVSQ